MNEFLVAAIDFLVLVLKLSVPIALGALAGTLSERAGVINLGLEGMMLCGAFAGAAGSGFFKNPWAGVAAAVICGCLIGFLHGFFCLTLRGQPIVVGVAINLFAAGITPMLCKIFWNKEGASLTVPTVSPVSIPLLCKIPIIGGLFTEFSPYVMMMFAVFIFLWIAFYRTKYGLRLRMIGDHPMGVQAQGVNTILYKYVAVILSGAIAALGGSFLSISQSNVFVMNMTAGRGYMGLAANIFGGWTPGGSMLASLFFAAVQSTRYYLIDSGIPDQFVQMIPYLATLLILIFFGRNSKSPEALGTLAEH